MQKLKYITKNILFSFLAVLILFLILEVIVRVGMTWRHDDVSFLKYGFVHFSRLRLKDLSDNRADYHSSNYHIDVFGGSVVWGWDLKHGTEDFPHQLELILNERLGTNRIKVSNKGTPGETSRKILEEVLSTGDDSFHDKYHAQIYIVYMGVNDALKLYTASTGTMHLQGEEFGYNKFELTPIQKVYFFFKKTLLSFSLADDILSKYKIPGRKVVGQRLPDIIFGTVRKLKFEKGENEKHIQIFLDRYRDNLITIINFCRLYNIRLIFGREAVNENAEQPELINSYMKYYNLVYEQMEKIAKEQGIIYVDVNAYFSKLPNKEKYFLYSGRDWCHHNTEGYRIIGEIFADVIIENNLIAQ